MRISFSDSTTHTTMQKLTLLLSLAVLLAFSSCAKKTTTAATSPNGGRDWTSLAATYKKNPDALRQLVEDCEATEAQLASTRQQLNEFRTQSGTANQDINALRTNLTNAQMENDQLRQQVADANARAAAATSATNDRLDTDQQTVVAGVIFQVQLGAYAKNTVNPDLSTGNALELQEQNGVQKVVVSQFRTYASAAKLRDRLKIMGVTGAFVVAKNNGVRISVPEALKMTGQG
jgi:septal ring factor EnvC (AmiA/AmiB activator)